MRCSAFFVYAGSDYFAIGRCQAESAGDCMATYYVLDNGTRIAIAVIREFGEKI